MYLTIYPLFTSPELAVTTFSINHKFNSYRQEFLKFFKGKVIDFESIYCKMFFGLKTDYLGIKQSLWKQLLAFHDWKQTNAIILTSEALCHWGWENRLLALWNQSKFLCQTGWKTQHSECVISGGRAHFTEL